MTAVMTRVSAGAGGADLRHSAGQIWRPRPSGSATTARMVSTVLQGFYQSVEATASSSLVNTRPSAHRGAIGKPGAGPLLMAGQPSAMSQPRGGRGRLLSRLPQSPQRSAHEDLCELWNIDFDKLPSRGSEGHLQDAGDRRARRDRIHVGDRHEPDRQPARPEPHRARSSSSCSSSCRIRSSTPRSVALADIYFPAAMWGEKTGCVTNAERSVNLLLKAVEPPGEARSDFDIFVEVAQPAGIQGQGRRAADPVCRAAATLSRSGASVSKGRPCDYSGMTYELILEKGAVRWPCNEQHPRRRRAAVRGLHVLDRHRRLRKLRRRFPDRQQAHPQRLRADRPQRQGVLEAGAVASPAQPAHRRLPVRADHRARGVPLPHADQDRPIDSVEPAGAARLCRDPPATMRHRLGIGLGDLVEVTSPHGRWEGWRWWSTPCGRAKLFMPFHYGHGVAVGQPAHLVRARPGQQAAAVQILARRSAAAQFRRSRSSGSWRGSRNSTGHQSSRSPPENSAAPSTARLTHDA